jgi:hypothetical protein
MRIRAATVAGTVAVALSMVAGAAGRVAAGTSGRAPPEAARLAVTVGPGPSPVAIVPSLPPYVE